MNPEELLLQRGLAQAIQSGQVKSKSDAVAWLRSKGYDASGRKIEQPSTLGSVASTVGKNISDALLGWNRGLAEAGYGTMQGAVNLFTGADSPAAEAVRRNREEMREYYTNPEYYNDTAGGTLGTVAGGIAGTGAQFMLPGVALGRAGQALGALSEVPALSRLASPLATAGRVATRIAAPIEGTGLGARAARVGSGALLNAPLNIAMAQSPEDSMAGFMGEAFDSPVMREVAKDPFLSTGVETLADVIAGGAFEGAGAGIRKFGESAAGQRIANLFSRKAPEAAVPTPIVPQQLPGDVLAGPQVPPTIVRGQTRSGATLRPRGTSPLKAPGDVPYEDVQRIFTGTVPEVVEEAPIRRTLGPRSGPTILDPEQFGALPGVAERPSMLQRAIESPYRNALGAALGVTGLGLGMSRMGAREPQTPEEDGLAVREANVGPLGAIVLAGTALVGGRAAARQGLLRSAERAAMTDISEGFVAKLYSRLDNAIAHYKDERTTGKQWADALKSNVNSREVQWTGLDRFLAERLDKQVTRDEIIDFLQKNPVEVGEKVLTGNQVQYGPGSGEFGFDATPNVPKKNYREILISFRPKQGATRTYVSPHWEAQDNNLVHLRLFDVDMPDGSRGLFVSEIQSDLHQGARKNQKLIERILEGRKKKSPSPLPFDPEFGEIGPDPYMRTEQQQASAELIEASNELHALRSARGPHSYSVEKMRLPTLTSMGDTGLTYDQTADIYRAFRDGDADDVMAIWEESRKLKNKKLNSLVDDLTLAWLDDNELGTLDFVDLLEKYTDDEVSASGIMDVLDEYTGPDEFAARMSQKYPKDFKVAETNRQSLLDRVQQISRAEDKYNRLTEAYKKKYGSFGRVPEAPFSKTEEWFELGLRRAMHEAVAGGYDHMVFINGPQAGKANNRADTFFASRLRLEPTDKRVASPSGARMRVAKLNGWDSAGKKLPTISIEYAQGDDLLGELSKSVPKAKAEELVSNIGADVVGDAPYGKGTMGLLSFYDTQMPSWIKRIAGIAPSHVSLPKMKGRGMSNNPNLSIPVTPELRNAVASGQRMLVPALLAGGAAALAPSEAEAQDGSPEQASGGLSIPGMLAVGAAAFGLYKVRGKWNATKAALEAARSNPTRVNLAQIAEDAFRANKAELKGEQAAARAARNAERIRKPIAPYPEDAYRNPTSPEHVFRMAGRILTDPATADEIADATKELVESGRIATSGRIPWETERQLAEQLGLKVDDLATRDPSRALSGTELLALRNVYFRDLRRKALVKKVMNGGAQYTLEERNLAERLYDALDTRTQNQLQRLLRDQNQKGRDLNSMKIVVKESSDPNDWLYRAQKLAGGRELTSDIVQEIMAAGNRQDWVKMELALAKARTLNKGFIDKFNEWWQTSLLASVARPLRDLMGNATNALDTAAKHVLAGQIERTLVGLGVFSQRTSGNVGVRRIATVASKAAKKGVQQAKAIIKGGASTPEELAALERAARRYDFSNESAFENPILRAYSTFIRRTIGAADQPFYEMSFAMAIESMARAEGQNAGLRGLELDRFVEGRVANPSSEMTMTAMQEALEGVWQNETALGKVGAAIQGGPQSGAVHRLVGKQILPFSTTPSAFTTQTLESNPLGLIGASPDALAAAAGSTIAQRKLIRKLAKVGTGTAWIVLGYMLADEGKLTTSYPQDEGEKALWSETGRQPNSLLLAKKWIPLSGLLGPQAQLMGIGAYLRKSLVERETAPALAIAEAGTAGVAKTLQDSPVMQGIKHANEIVEAATTDDPNKRSELLSDVLQSQVSGFVPRFIQQVAQAGDTDASGNVIMRDPTAGEGLAADIVGSLQQTIPGARSGLPPKISPFGRVRTSGAGGLAAVLSPVRTVEAYNTPLTLALEEAGAFPATPRRQRNKESVEMYNLKRMVQGPEEESFLMRLMGGDPSAMTYVSAEAEDEYNQTGDIAVLVASALKNFRSEQSRALRESGGIP